MQSVTASAVTIAGVDGISTEQSTEFLTVVIARIYGICYSILLDVVLESPSRESLQYHCLIMKRIPLMVILLLANQDVMRILLKYMI